MPAAWRSEDAMLAAAKPYLLRILGPNCVGLVVPGLNLNASFAHVNALRGKIAFLSQSGRLVTAVLDWARSRSIGFSKLISLGDCADVDFGDVIDYLGRRPETHAILLYIESITAARKFMSAARAAARNKPVLVLKAGRAPEGARAAASHTGALAGTDAVTTQPSAAPACCACTRLQDLFDTVETLARARPLRGDGLTIVTNGGGPEYWRPMRWRLEAGDWRSCPQTLGPSWMRCCRRPGRAAIQSTSSETLRSTGT